MKRGRGRPRKSSWKELDEKRRWKFNELYLKGETYAEMGRVLYLPDWEVKSIERERVMDGKLIFLKRIRKHRRKKKPEKDLWDDNIFLYVLLSTRAGRSLFEMAEAIGKSYEWMRQSRKKAKGKPGWLKNTLREKQDGENKKLIEAVAKELKMKTVDLERRLFGKRMKSGTETEALMVMIDKYKGNKKGVCQNCGRRFIRKQTGKRQFCYRLKCKRKMENIAHKKTAQKTGVAPISRKSLRMRWIVKLFEKLRGCNLSENEKWLTVKEAMGECGASQTQIRWLGQRRILTKGKHPIKSWHGKPVEVYPASQIRIINEVLGPRR